jgi:HK97 family phage portal protein
MSALQLDAGRHQSGALMAWLAKRPGGLARAAVKPLPNLVNLTAVSSDNEAMRALFAPLPASSGFAVTDYTAMLVSTIFRCLSTIAGAWTQLPVHQYRMLAGGARETMDQTPLWWLLNESPEDQWTAASWREWIVRCVHLRGDQHTEIIRKQGVAAGGAVESLRPHHPDNVKVHCVDRRLVYSVFDPETRRTYGVDQDDMLHFSGFGFDGKKSLSVVQHAARNSIGNALAASDFTGRQLGEGAMPKIALTYPNKLESDQAALLRESFVAAYSGPGSQKLPLVLTQGGEAKQLTWSAVDLELLESRRFEREDMCQACGVPPVLIGENEKTSSWGTGIEQIMLGFVKLTIKPHLNRWTQEMNRKLFRRAGQFLEHDYDELLRGDTKAQGEYFRSALGGPSAGDATMTVNEIRRVKNLPPDADPESDKLYRAPRAVAGAPGTTPPPPKEAA